MSVVWEFLETLINEGEDAARKAFPGATIESSPRFGYIVTVPTDCPPMNDTAPDEG